MNTIVQYDTVAMDGPLSPSLAKDCGFSVEGCPYRGSTVCHVCPFAAAIPVLCDYKCRMFRTYRGRQFRYDCQHRSYCKCGHDQTERLRAWGLVE